MQRYIYFYGTLLVLIWGLLLGCSTTTNIPNGEQLYTGIKRIDYHFENSRTSSKTNDQKRPPADSTGVIASIATAVSSIEDALKGGGQPTPVVAQGGGLVGMVRRNRVIRKRRKARQKSEKKTVNAVSEELAAVLSYAPNGSLFGSSSITSPIKFGLWTHNQYVNAEKGFGKWMFDTFAEAPILISNVAPATRAKVATNTLRNHGYFRAKVEHEILSRPTQKKAQVAYDVYPGSLFYLDEIEYLNFDATADSLLRLTNDQKVLRQDESFSVRKLVEEQQRIEKLMRNNGYFFHAPAHTLFKADTTAQPLRVQLRVYPDPNRPQQARHPWYMGHTHITIRDLKGSAHTQTKTLPHFTFHFPGQKIPLRSSMWTQAVAHRYGETYSLAKQQATLERLYATGIFSTLEVDYLPHDTTATADTLDLYITATLAPDYDASIEMNGTLKSNQQVGPGLVFDLAKLNAFRGAETVNFKIFGNYDWQMGGGRNGGNALLNSYQLGTSLSFKLPRLLLPTGLLSNSPLTKRDKLLTSQQRPIVGSTTIAVNADWRKRSGFFEMISMGGNLSYKWYTHPRYQHDLSLFNLEYNRIVNTTYAFDSIIVANPALFASMSDQFVPSMGYSFTYQSAASRLHPKWLQLTFKESGNLLSALYAAAGQSWRIPYKKILDTPFAQFVKATAEYRYTRTLSPRLKLATRAFVGAVLPYGNSVTAPYSEQFYIGGANSIRGFSVRTAGPGGYTAPPSPYSYIDQTGDIKLEANAELRAHLMGSLYGAVFVDAGNVWLVNNDVLRPEGDFSWRNLRRLAVGTGLGLRYDMQFLVFRFDAGIALHAPYDTGRSGFYNIPHFKDGWAFHFAIGYPF